MAIFVDGENFRNIICKLFPEEHNKPTYLPVADWGDFYRKILDQSVSELGIEKLSFELSRCYWYVVGEFDFNNYFESYKFTALSLEERIEYFRSYAKSVLGSVSEEKKVKQAAADRCKKHLESQAKIIRERQDRWSTIQDEIQQQTNKLEFRRFGHIYVNLDRLEFREEKGTDVQLALDMYLFREMYDIAVLVSGDADYIPAVSAVKSEGKHVVNVDFLDRTGKLLPGGARKLKMYCDATVSVPFETMKTAFKY